MPFDREFVSQRLKDSSAAIGALARQADLIQQIGAAVRECFARGGHLYTCGNGGSAAEALHLSEELIGRYRADRRPYPAVSLSADPTALTCIANDFGFDAVFARQIEALGRPGDCLVAFSTSGKSPNIVKALAAAKSRGMTTIGLLGKGGGPSAPHCDLALVVEAPATETIQECHQVVLHLILEAVEAPGH